MLILLDTCVQQTLRAENDFVVFRLGEDMCVLYFALLCNANSYFPWIFINVDLIDRALRSLVRNLLDYKAGISSCHPSKASIV